MSQSRNKWPKLRATNLPAISLVLLSLGVLIGSASAQSFSSATRYGVIESQDINEASGLIASRQNPGVLWTHNDSAPTLYAISTNGALLGTYPITTVFSGDFEDIAIGPGRRPEYQYLYLGDIGDNALVRDYVRVIRMPEPAVSLNPAIVPWYQPAIDPEEIFLRYPDGPFNAEALLIDPLTGDLFVATKLTNSARIYQATRAQLDAGGVVNLSFVREISFFKVSGGDISPDGRLIILRRGGTAWLWTRSATQTVGDALAAAGKSIPVANEPNGEAVAFHATGLGYFTLSEGFNQTNYYYRRTDTANLPRQPVVPIPPDAVWRYHDGGVDLGSSWRNRDYDDTDWSQGPAPLGYGQGDEATVISYGVDDFDKNPTTYFRRLFVLSSTAITNLAVRACFNDGLAVYLNGTEIWRQRLAPNAAYGDHAIDDGSTLQNIWQSIAVPPSLLRVGTNVVAAEVHRHLGWEPDLTFDLQLTEGVVEPMVRFSAPPQRTNSLWQVRLTGPAGALARVEGSTDSTSWTVVGQTVLTNGLGLVNDPTPFDHRVYRVRR